LDKIFEGIDKVQKILVEVRMVSVGCKSVSEKFEAILQAADGWLDNKICRTCGEEVLFLV